MVTTVIAGLAILAVIVTAFPLFDWIADRRAPKELPLIFSMPPRGNGASPKPPSPRRPPERRSAPVTRSTSPPVVPQMVSTPVASPVAPIAPPVARSRPPLRRGALAVLDDSNQHEVSSTETVRFRRPGDEPVQIVPGRLEVLAGETQLREIRFVRVPGRPLQLILGRDGGPSAQYIGLSSPTVSRRHAHFTYADGRWKVKNLSKTNPLVVNDDEVCDTAGERTLIDGDRLELGEVVLRFHVQ